MKNLHIIKLHVPKLDSKELLPRLFVATFIQIEQKTTSKETSKTTKKNQNMKTKNEIKLTMVTFFRLLDQKEFHPVQIDPRLIIKNIGGEASTHEKR